MRILFKTPLRCAAILGLAMSIAPIARSAETICEPGAYGAPDQDVVVLEAKDWIPSPGLGYLILDGRYGSTLAPDSPVSCGRGYVILKTETSGEVRLEQRVFKRTREEIPVADAVLVGELVEPTGAGVAPIRPLVVMVHGSETEPAIGNNRAYLLAAQGMTVFTYDKRGTGRSGGFYTQNFELLADDAAAAMNHAQSLAQGHFSRSGYWGQSQGGWVAPLAATRSKVDFVAVGFGLVTSPIDEDREQMLLEAETLGLNDHEAAEIRKLSGTTATIVASHFTRGFEALESLRRKTADEKWVHLVNGEYSGDMLRMNDSDLRRVGRAVFDNLEIIWDYNSTTTLNHLNIPILWVIAEQDRQAPIAATTAALRRFREKGKAIDVYVFPETDHGMYEFVQAPDGSRRNTRVTEGYFRLIGNWITGNSQVDYGRAVLLPTK
ncbi:alpha/beta hydrolase family protein [Asticcacaulis sp.]|uniref:alpha/beta hydrolase family protein n=1 Tax=Asticcacaulis sp. TaxID=1872648 RepID=UPI003F7B5CFE